MTLNLWILNINKTSKMQLIINFQIKHLNITCILCVQHILSKKLNKKYKKQSGT